LEGLVIAATLIGCPVVTAAVTSAVIGLARSFLVIVAAVTVIVAVPTAVVAIAAVIAIAGMAVVRVIGRGG